ncbi:MAG: DUF4142 domain-containing protein [Gemmataceae bacterium]|nr:DUF4142 domain-containing protein [Gemmataceae bacterium]
MRFLLSFAALSMVLGSFCAPATADDKAKDTGTVTDEQFVMKASASGLAEINLGMLATRRAANPDVKKFGQHMVDDHTKANKELLTIAGKKSFSVADRMDKQHQDAADALAKLEGSDFDRQFMSQMVKDHEEAVALFTAKAKDAKDSDLRAFAEKTLPTLKEHHKMARDLADKMKNGKQR